MARAYSGVLGSLAMCLVILRGVLLDQPANDILTRSLAVFFLFSAIGFCLGHVAQKTVYESVESRFRQELARLESAAASKGTETSEP